MDRDEFLATIVMGWTKGQYWLKSGEYWFSGIRFTDTYRNMGHVNDWNPGESWPQTGMLLRQVQKELKLTVYEYTGEYYSQVGYHVIFTERKFPYETLGQWIDIDLREAIATAAAKTKGWVDDRPAR